MLLSNNNALIWLGKDRLRHHGEDRFIVKVQGGTIPGASPLMIYDQSRTFQIIVDVTTSPGREVLAFMTTKGTPSGYSYPASVKSFMFASTEEGGLRLGLDQLAPYQSW